MQKEDKNTAVHIAYDDYEPFDIAEPERNLMRAVLMSALSDLRKTGESGRRATEFFLSHEADYVFSFRAICSYLNVDADRVLLVAGLRD